MRLKDERKLSFLWKCGGATESEIEDAALAIAAAGQRIDKIDIVWLDYDILLNDGLEFRDTQGRTAVTDLAQLHVDLCKLDYIRLGRVAHRVRLAIGDQECGRINRPRVKQLLKVALDQGRIDEDQLSEHLQKEIER